MAEHALREGPCVMRAVPYEDTKAHPPGSAAEEAADQFQGPHIANSRFETYSDDSIGDDYEFEANSLSSEFEIQSVGDCGLYRSNLFAPDSLAKSTRLFECDAALYEENASPSGQSTRSELLIDGANAYSPATAAYVEKALATTIPGAPQISATQSFDKATGLLTIREIDRIVRCSPEASFPPTTKSCTGFVPTGVQLERIWQTDDANHVALMTDSWSSLDGYPHTLDALYHQELVDAGKSGGADELPGSSAFSATTRGQLATLPAGPGAIYHKVDGETATAGDGEHPQGAIVYDPAPSGPLAVFEGSGEGSYDGFEMPYQGTIPASGPYTVRMAFIQAYALPGSRSAGQGDDLELPSRADRHTASNGPAAARSRPHSHGADLTGCARLPGGQHTCFRGKGELHGGLQRPHGEQLRNPIDAPHGRASPQRPGFCRIGQTPPSTEPCPAGCRRLLQARGPSGSASQGHDRAERRRQAPAGPLRTPARAPERSPR